jgi:GMP synthase (glutamine-hydrolysing)
MNRSRASLRYLLLQVRNADDPMRSQEVDCFARALQCDRGRIEVIDLMGRECASAAGTQRVQRADVVLLGGSGDYSVSEGGEWLEPALDVMRGLHARRQPTFATCWGFQALARAVGGEVIADPASAEIGTLDVRLTEAGRSDPVFGALEQAGATFAAHIGHQDVVSRLPADAVLLAETDRAPHAYTFSGLPIYCTQFHPELNRTALLERLRQYPKYVENITGLPMGDFVAQRTAEAPHAEALIARFVDQVFG